MGRHKMKFVRTEQLTPGMRLARPIYNKQGVLLFERDSKLTPMGINSVKNFGLIGLYVLEPAEPVPPMTQDDIEFERFQTMASFSIQDELKLISTSRKQAKTQMIASMIIKNYGHLDHKINFIQNLRSREDYVCKHSLNVAILCTMMCHKLNMKLEEQLQTVIAGIVHDVGKWAIANQMVDGDDLTPEQEAFMTKAEIFGYEAIEAAYGDGGAIKRICAQSQRLMSEEANEDSLGKVVLGAKVLTVAKTFDSMTAMKLGKDPASEVSVVRHLLEHPEIYDMAVVNALLQSINILVPGISVELSTGEKALVLVENGFNILRPTVLSFTDNSIIDLSNTVAYGDVEIVDIMKTLDNRYIFDSETLAAAGFGKSAPKFV